MYLCTYNIFCFVEKKKRYGEKTILVSVCILGIPRTYIHVLVSVPVYGMDLYRNNTLSSILWTTTFACAKLICQIKKCQTYFHTSTYLYCCLNRGNSWQKFMNAQNFIFFCFQQRVWVRPELLNIGHLPAGGQVKQSDAAMSRPPQLLWGQFQHTY